MSVTGASPAIDEALERLRAAQDRLNARERDRLRVFSAAASAADRAKARDAVEEALAGLMPTAPTGHGYRHRPRPPRCCSPT